MFSNFRAKIWREIFENVRIKPELSEDGQTQDEPGPKERSCGHFEPKNEREREGNGVIGRDS